jgi:cation:H+ antiporter
LQSGQRADFLTRFKGIAVLLSCALIIVGMILLVAGGETLLRGAVGLATLLGLTPAVIGLTVVAAGTSVPELAVSTIATYRGSLDIAVANVIGSNIFNITVIIGLCALVRPVAIIGNTFKLEYPVLALVTLLALVVVEDEKFSRLDATLCLAVYVCFTAYLVILVREQVTAAERRGLKTEVAELTPTAAPRQWVSIVLVAVGIILLAIGAQLTVTGAVQLARLVGWSERVIGLTIVSAGTGLPEVVASLVSSIRGRSDVAIGNVIGSNLFNILCILGLSAMIRPLPVSTAIVASDCWWMLGSTLLLLPLMFTSRLVSRREGVVLLIVYGIYLWQLLARD